MSPTAEDRIGVSNLYIDTTALVLPGGATPAGEQLAPGVADALAMLSEAGFDVVVLGNAASCRGLPPRISRQERLPERLAPDEWFVTGDPDPSFGRPRGGRTVFVGPRRQPGRVPLPRFDLEARDLAAAAMEILTRQALA